MGYTFFYLFFSHVHYCISQKEEKTNIPKCGGISTKCFFINVFHLVRIQRTRIKQYVFVRVPSWASF